MIARITRYIPRRLAVALGSTIAVLGLGLGTLALSAGGASAAPLPAGLHPETFTINIFDNYQAGQAAGPLRGYFRDVSITPTDDVFKFGGAKGSVNVHHTAVPNPAVNPRSCTGFAVHHGVFELNGVSGRYRHAEGFGRFTAYEWVQEAREHGHCDANSGNFEAFVTASGLASTR
jgi:hypothetical protein